MKHCCDEIMDYRQMVLYREYCFPNCTKLWRMKLLFRFWGGDDRPNRPPLYPPVRGIILEACVLKLQNRYQSATHIWHQFHQVTFSGEPLCNSLRWSGKKRFSAANYRFTVFNLTWPRLDQNWLKMQSREIVLGWSLGRFFECNRPDSPRYHFFRHSGHMTKTIAVG